MLYAAEHQSVPIVTHGPFVGESRGDLVRLSQAYVDGQMPRVSDLG
jgi:redox-sensitive bicupin YhaK (pirin superfamily)